MAGEAISDFIGFFAGFFDDRVALYGKDLSDKRKVEVAVQLGRGPDGARLEAAVCQGDGVRYNQENRDFQRPGESLRLTKVDCLWR